jgi:hypothetical protein
MTKYVQVMNCLYKDHFILTWYMVIFIWILKIHPKDNFIYMSNFIHPWTLWSIPSMRLMLHAFVNFSICCLVKALFHQCWNPCLVYFFHNLWFFLCNTSMLIQFSHYYTTLQCCYTSYVIYNLQRSDWKKHTQIQSKF